ncbi:MAG: acyltransferase family protein [Bacteroidaceae bacterium]|nr:acyltransferase family protein [Bacteroidaceae bacterium]
MTATSQPTKRIEYIDALRGFTMILVVFSHVEMTSLGFTPPTFLNSLFMSFRMPLFFFISGFIAYKAGVEWNRDKWCSMSKKKILVQLVPTFIFGLIYTYAYFGVDFQSFITHNGKLGYWFTIALLEIFLIVYTANTLLYTPNEKTFRKRMVVALILLSGGLFIAKFAIKMLPALNEIGNIFTLHHTFNYFQYFAFGYICSMYKEAFNKSLDNKFVVTGVLLLFAVGFYVKQCYIGNFVGNGLDVWKLLDTFAELILGYLGLLIVYNTIRKYQNSFTANTKIGASLQYIGKRTLDIYLLHYFLLPNLLLVSGFLQTWNNVVLELFVGVAVSLLVICICLLISNILRTSPILAEYLFGVKAKNKRVN